MALTKRIAAISLAAAIGFAGFAGTAHAEPTATPSPEASTSAPTKSTSASPSSTPTKEAKKNASFKGAVVEWYRGQSTGTMSGQIVDNKGMGLAGVKLTAYDYTGGKIGKEIGSGTTDAKGNFKFTVKIINGADGSVDVALVYEGNDEFNRLVGTTTVKADQGGSMAPSKKPSTKPTKDKDSGKGEKEKSGGLASTGA